MSPGQCYNNIQSLLAGTVWDLQNLATAWKRRVVGPANSPHTFSIHVSSASIFIVKRLRRLHKYLTASSLLHSLLEEVTRAHTTGHTCNLATFLMFQLCSGRGWRVLVHARKEGWWAWGGRNGEWGMQDNGALYQQPVEQVIKLSVGRVHTKASHYTAFQIGQTWNWTNNYRGGNKFQTVFCGKWSM